MLPGPHHDGNPCAHSSFLLLVLAPATFRPCAVLLSHQPHGDDDDDDDDDNNDDDDDGEARMRLWASS